MARRPVGGSSTIPAWTAGTYTAGATVTHQNQIWKANADGTTTEPGVAGWTSLSGSGGGGSSIAIQPTAPTDQTPVWIKTPS